MMTQHHLGAVFQQKGHQLRHAISCRQMQRRRAKAVAFVHVQVLFRHEGPYDLHGRFFVGQELAASFVRFNAGLRQRRE